MNAVKIVLLTVGLLVSASPLHASLITPFISELHYDNIGADVGEFVAITGPQGFDVSDWQIVFYNGSNGLEYRSLTLSGVLAGALGGSAEAFWDITGIQNGPDAVALVSDVGDVVDFVAYEGAVSAHDGAALGMTARVTPVSEGTGTAVGESLQRVGALDDWLWSIAPATPGAVNSGLQLDTTSAVSLPATAALCLTGLVGLRMAPGARAARPGARG